MKDLSEHNLEPFAELERALEAQQHGTATVTIQVYAGKIVGLKGSQFQTLKYREGENARAVAAVVHALKQMSDEKRTGDFQIVTTLSEGSIKQVYIEKRLKKTYAIKDTIDKHA